MWREIPELYEIAKRITLSYGCPYTDPRTGHTTYPKKPRKTKKRPRSNKGSRRR